MYPLINLIYINSNLHLYRSRSTNHIEDLPFQANAAHPPSNTNYMATNVPPPNLVLVYMTVWEVRPSSLKWRGLNVPRQSGYVPGRTAW